VPEKQGANNSSQGRTTPRGPSELARHALSSRSVAIRRARPGPRFSAGPARSTWAHGSACRSTAAPDPSRSPGRGRAPHAASHPSRGAITADRRPDHDCLSIAHRPRALSVLAVICTRSFHFASHFSSSPSSGIQGRKSCRGASTSRGKEGGKSSSRSAVMVIHLSCGLAAQSLSLLGSSIASRPSLHVPRRRRSPVTGVAGQAGAGSKWRGRNVHVQVLQP
jgi:hypothetical protein